MNADIQDMLTEEVWRAIQRHALAEYPSECCGMIHRSGRLRVCRNAQDEFHALDPIGFPLTAANGFVFGFVDQLFLAESFESDDPICVVYHSHPDGQPSLSWADRKAMSFDGGPWYPGLAQLVVAGSSEEQFSGAVFSWVEGGFRCVWQWPLAQNHAGRSDSYKTNSNKLLCQ